VGWCLKRKFKTKLEIQVHGDFFGNYYRRQWWRLSLARFIINRADKIRVVGERIKQSLFSLGVAENKITVRPVQNDPELIKNLPVVINLRDKYRGYEKIFLVLGRLDPVKNICWLVDIFKEVAKKKNYLLLIVGRGLEENNIRKQIARNNLSDNVILQNWTEDPYSYLKTADCVLFPSLSEGYGLVPMEASIIGTPVIMTDVGVANYELPPGPKVKIVPVGDKDAFVKEMLKI
jgi:glycosyltransferase involved in cell wall biosynthesis